MKSVVVVSLFALLFSFTAIGSFLQKSATYDEPIHLFAGYSHIKWGDFRPNPEHPPLAKSLAALPLLALAVNDSRPLEPLSAPETRGAENWWVAAHHMLFLDNNADRLFFYAKLPMVAIGLVLATFVYLWGKQLYGTIAALFGLLFFGLDPNILAHTPIVHTDMPLAALFFIGSYFYWRVLNRLTWARLLLTSLLFGLSVVTKYSSLIILPVWAILGLLRIFSHEPLTCRLGTERTLRSPGEKTVALATVLVAAVVTAYLSIWAAYGFRFEPFQGEEHLPIARVLPQSGFLRMSFSLAAQYQLLPEAWIYGLLYVVQSSNRPAYLLGQISESGFWLYFPLAFAVKTPVPTLLLLLGTLKAWAFERKAKTPELFLLIPAALYFAVAVWSKFNIGSRHLLPVYPFLYVLVGGYAARLWVGGSRAKKGFVALLALWQLWSSTSIYPHYLAYFNELAGGAKNGYKVLTDSSLDWGQDLKGLKRWMDANGVKKIQLGYFGTADPQYYGIDADYLPGSIIFSPRKQSQDPEPPKYLAVSATYIYGVHSAEPLKGFYKRLREKQPIAIIGHSIFVYRAEGS